MDILLVWLILCSVHQLVICGEASTKPLASGNSNHLIESLRNMGRRALINLDYKCDFERDFRNGFKVKSNDDKIVPSAVWVFG